VLRFGFCDSWYNTVVEEAVSEWVDKYPEDDLEAVYHFGSDMDSYEASNQDSGSRAHPNSHSGPSSSSCTDAYLDRNGDHGKDDDSAGHRNCLASHAGRAVEDSKLS
jgi:hypothetical protein